MEDLIFTKDNMPDIRVPFLTEKQRAFTISEKGKRQKLRGPAGSGKSLIIAGRAVECFRRTRSKVLLLYVNDIMVPYTAGNIIKYAHDEDEKKMLSENIEIMTIYDFILRSVKEISLKNKMVHPHELIDKNIELLYTHKNLIGKDRLYECVLTDDVQDYEYNWLECIYDLFFNKSGEWFSAGDENQNVYKRMMIPGSDPISGCYSQPAVNHVSEAWAEIKETHRLPPVITELANSFKKQFLYEYKQESISCFEGAHDEPPVSGDVSYRSLNKKSDAADICKTIISMTETENSLPEDMVILSDDIKLLKEMHHIYKNICSDSVILTETKDEDLMIIENAKKIEDVKRNKYLEDERCKIRRDKLKNYSKETGNVIFCPLKEYKGMEAETVFLVISDNELGELSDEAVYTGITRAKKCLVVINMNIKYDVFFKEYE